MYLSSVDRFGLTMSKLMAATFETGENVNG
jgi:hypothetical protein